MGRLHDETVKKLALITWHFGAGEDSEDYEAHLELAHFLRHPTDNTAWRDLRARYYNYTPFESLRDFKASHYFLLSLLLG